MNNLTKREAPTGKKLALLYGFFAVLAILCNVGTQAATNRILALIIGTPKITTPALLFVPEITIDINMFISIIAATGISLIFKYLLDKNYIFIYEADGLKDDGKKFILYTIMGIATTLIFFAFEYSFEYIYKSEIMRYTGAVIGLTIGYWVKYQLDKRFVFPQSNP